MSRHVNPTEDVGERGEGEIYHERLFKQNYEKYMPGNSKFHDKQHNRSLSQYSRRGKEENQCVDKDECENIPYYPDPVENNHDKNRKSRSLRSNSRYRASNLKKRSRSRERTPSSSSNSHNSDNDSNNRNDYKKHRHKSRNKSRDRNRDGKNQRRKRYYDDYRHNKHRRRSHRNIEVSDNNSDSNNSSDSFKRRHKRHKKSSKSKSKSNSRSNHNSRSKSKQKNDRRRRSRSKRKRNNNNNSDSSDDNKSKNRNKDRHRNRDRDRQRNNSRNRHYDRNGNRNRDNDRDRKKRNNDYYSRHNSQESNNKKYSSHRSKSSHHNSPNDNRRSRSYRSSNKYYSPPNDDITINSNHFNNNNNNNNNNYNNYDNYNIRDNKKHIDNPNCYENNEGKYDNNNVDDTDGNYQTYNNTTTLGESRKINEKNPYSGAVLLRWDTLDEADLVQLLTYIIFPPEEKSFFIEPKHNLWKDRTVPILDVYRRLCDYFPREPRSALRKWLNCNIKDEVEYGYIEIVQMTYENFKFKYPPFGSFDFKLKLKKKRQSQQIADIGRIEKTFDKKYFLARGPDNRELGEHETYDQALKAVRKNFIKVNPGVIKKKNQCLSSFLQPDTPILMTLEDEAQLSDNSSIKILNKLSMELAFLLIKVGVETISTLYNLLYQWLYKNPVKNKDNNESDAKNIMEPIWETTENGEKLFKKLRKLMDRIQDLDRNVPLGYERGLVKNTKEWSDLEYATIIDRQGKLIRVDNENSDNIMQKWVGCIVDFKRDMKNMATDVMLVRSSTRLSALSTHYQYLDVTQYHRDTIDYFMTHTFQPKKPPTIEDFIKDVKHKLKVNDGSFKLYEVERLYEPKFLGYHRIRDIFHKHKELKSICKLDNADNTTLVVTHDRSTKAPSWEEIKKNVLYLTQRHQDKSSGTGYRLDLLRSHWTDEFGYAIKPKAWKEYPDFKSIKDIIRRCEEEKVIKFATDIYTNGKWALFTPDQYKNRTKLKVKATNRRWNGKKNQSRATYFQPGEKIPHHGFGNENYNNYNNYNDDYNYNDNNYNDNYSNNYNNNNYNDYYDNKGYSNYRS